MFAALAHRDDGGRRRLYADAVDALVLGGAAAALALPDRRGAAAVEGGISMAVVSDATLKVHTEDMPYIAVRTRSKATER